MRPRPKKRGKAALAAGAALVLAAAAARLFLAPPAETPDARQARKYFYEDVLEPFFGPSDKRPGWMTARRDGATAADFQAVKPAGAFRVFVVGGSIAQKYAEFENGSLAAALRAALPSSRVEIVDCGMMGYESSRERALVHELLDYHPDAIVLLSGQNEGLGSPPVARWRLKLLEALRALGISPEALATGRAAPGARRAAIDAAFRTNLAAMADEARARGSRLVVVLPPLNYRDNPPPGRFAAREPPLAEGWSRYLKNDCAGASAAWRPAASGGDAHTRAVARFLLARCAERLGRLDEARGLYYSSFEDGELRASPARLELMRAAAKDGGAALVDGDAAFRAKAGARLPGLDYFADRVHWLDSRNDLLTAAILPVLRADAALSSLAWDDAALRRLAALVAAGRSIPGQDSSASLEEESMQALRQAFADLQGSGDDPSLEAIVFLDALLSRYPRWFSDLDSLVARAESGAGQGGKPWGTPPLRVDPARAAWHLGEIYLARGRVAQARAMLSRAALDALGPKAARGGPRVSCPPPGFPLE